MPDKEEKFVDRTEAGIRLAKELSAYAGKKDTVVCALPRGGVVLGVEVARELELPLDLLIPRKIGHPTQPEFAIAAVTEDGGLIEELAETSAVDREWFKEAVDKERQEARRRRETYLSGRPAHSLKGKTVIIVDDGIATGLTMKAAIDDAKNKGASQVVVAIPFCPKGSIEDLKLIADQVVTIFVPRFFLGSVGAYYEEFSQVEDAEVIQLMKKAA